MIRSRRREQKAQGRRREQNWEQKAHLMGMYKLNFQKTTTVSLMQTNSSRSIAINHVCYLLESPRVFSQCNHIFHAINDFRKNA